MFNQLARHSGKIDVVMVNEQRMDEFIREQKQIKAEIDDLKK
jgi:hypothetical protein